MPIYHQPSPECVRIPNFFIYDLFLTEKALNCLRFQSGTWLRKRKNFDAATTISFKHRIIPASCQIPNDQHIIH